MVTCHVCINEFLAYYGGQSVKRLYTYITGTKIVKNINERRSLSCSPDMRHSCMYKIRIHCHQRENVEGVENLNVEWTAVRYQHVVVRHHFTQRTYAIQ